MKSLTINILLLIIVIIPARSYGDACDDADPECGPFISQGTRDILIAQDCIAKVEVFSRTCNGVIQYRHEIQELGNGPFHHCEFLSAGDGFADIIAIKSMNEIEEEIPPCGEGTVEIENYKLSSCFYRPKCNAPDLSEEAIDEPIECNDGKTRFADDWDPDTWSPRVHFIPTFSCGQGCCKDIYEVCKTSTVDENVIVEKVVENDEQVGVCDEDPDCPDGTATAEDCTACN